MKDYSYYTDNKVVYPQKKDFTSFNVYFNGEVLGRHCNISLVNELKKENKNVVVETIFYEQEFKIYRDFYKNEQRRLMNEFKTDLYNEFDLDKNVGDLLYQYASGGHVSLFDIYEKFADLFDLYNGLEKLRK